MAEIRFEKVEKSFKHITVIKGIDLTIKDGEFFTFVGPSGCGKSTLLNIIAGLEPVTEGRIYFGDAIVNDLSPKERDVALVFQSYALYPHMTVYENIAFPLLMKKIEKQTIDKEVKRVSALLGLEEMLKRRPKELSGGQRQRVALGRAIIRRPKVFLMDEPLSNLDARLRIEMRAELKKLHQELKITTIYVTHDQAEAMSLSDRIAVLHQGEIQQCNSPAEVYLKPSNIFVAGFIGSPPMNLIDSALLKREPFTVAINDALFNPAVEKLPEGNRVKLGIRPDDIIISSEKDSGAAEAVTEIAEAEGAVTWVKVKWNGISLKGKMKGSELASTGSKVFLKIDDDSIHVFDYRSGARL